MKNKPLLVGVTGGIGAGKSVVCKVFQVLGTHVYNSDERAKYLLNFDMTLRTAVIAQFGADSYHSNSLNTQYLARTVFSDAEKLELLNSLVHPAVARDFDGWVNKNAGADYLIKEAALLFETKSYLSLDYTILVTAPEEIRTKRVLARDTHRSKQQIAEIMTRQLPDSSKKKLANFVLHNDNRELLLPRIIELDTFFRKEAIKKAQQEA